ncbi:hypothetical protein B0H14DRAFT_2505878 [Mycena olivaceomarginata]|nr:hypothetical protein B0H14DRAFT_2505878 [Mycena olivaceomarginata]
MNSHPSRNNTLDATILVLPPEITVNIFRLCLLAPIAAESDLDFATPPRPSSREAPLLLAQICRRWRDICLDTPEMWTSINSSHNGSIELLELWLSRTRNRSLIISLLIMDNCHNSRACTFMQAIMSRCSQWRDVRLHLPYCAIQQLDMFIFPRMERFRISTDDITGWAPQLGRWNSGCSTTSLRQPELCSSGRYSFGTLDHPSLPLSFRRCPNRRYLGVLQKHPRSLLVRSGKKHHT